MLSRAAACEAGTSDAIACEIACMQQHSMQHAMQSMRCTVNARQSHKAAACEAEACAVGTSDAIAYEIVACQAEAEACESEA